MPAEVAYQSAGPTLVDFIKSIESAADPDLALLEVSIASIQKQDPELALALHACAIPRRFDAAIAGIVLDRPEDREGNQQLIDRLLAFGLIRARSDDRYSYHEHAREALLRDWRRNPEKQAIFDDINRRLVSYYQEQHQQAQQLERDLGNVADILRQANVQRFVTLATIIESRVVTPLVEAMYHETLRSPQAGYDFFTHYAYAYETLGRPTIPETLRSTLHGFIQQLAPGPEIEGLQGWLRYWEIRLARRLRRQLDAESILKELLAQSGDDLVFKSWLLYELATLLADQSRPCEAQEIALQHLELVKETGIDSWNQPLIYNRLASLHWTLIELNQAVERYQQAIDAAARGNPVLGLDARLNLSGVQQELGRGHQALDLALEALHLARTEFHHERSLQQTVAWRFMSLFAGRWPQLLDTLFAEARRLLPAVEDPLPDYELQLQYTNLLRASGQLRRAGTTLHRLQRQTRAYQETPFFSELLLQQALWYEDTGRSPQAIDAYSQLINRAGTPDLVSKWLQAVAFTNRAVQYHISGRWPEAGADLETALTDWRHMGYEKFAALVEVIQADLWRQQSYAANLQRQLAGVPPLQEDETIGWQAELSRLHADWPAAGNQYRAALEKSHANHNPAGAAWNLVMLADIAAAQGDWPVAASQMAEAAHLWSQATPANPAPAFPPIDEESRRRWPAVQALLDKAQPLLAQASPGYLADFHQVQGHLYAGQEQWPAAEKHYRQALVIRRRLDYPRDVADHLTDLVLLAARQGKWPAAAAYTAEAAALWQQLAGLDAYESTRKEQRANTQNAEAIYALSETAGNRSVHLNRAQDLLSSICRRMPENNWYSLNLAYTRAQLADWAGAAQVLESILAAATGPLPTPLLYALAADYRRRQGDVALGRGQWQAANQAYEHSIAWLQQARPVTRLPAGRLDDIRLQLGDSLFKADRLHDARTQYEAALAVTGQNDDPSRLAALHARLGFLAAAQGDITLAGHHLSHSLALPEIGPVDEAAQVIASAVSPLIISFSHYQILSQAARSVAAAGTLNRQQQAALRAAQMDLSRNHYLPFLQPTAYERRGQPDYALPLVTPLALEAAEHLFPEGDDAPQDRLINEDIPAIRQRIQETMGVIIPGIRLRTNAYWNAGDYSLLLDEVPIVGGNVGQGLLFCPDLEGCRALGLSGQMGYNPITETDGLWLSESLSPEATAAGLEAWDAYRYLMVHLESFINQHLAHLVGLEETGALLDDWAGDDDRRRARLEATLPGSTGRLQLTRVLQHLLNESVPINDLDTILTIFAGEPAGAIKVGQVVEKVRLALKGRLPGNDGTRQLIALSPAFETAVAHQVWHLDGRQLLAMPPGEALDLIQTVRQQLAGRPARAVAIVVASAELRPFIRRLLELEFPSLAIMAAREVSDERIPPAEQIVYHGSTTTGDDNE